MRIICVLDMARRSRSGYRCVTARSSLLKGLRPVRARPPQYEPHAPPSLIRHECRRTVGAYGSVQPYPAASRRVEAVWALKGARDDTSWRWAWLAKDARETDVHVFTREPTSHDRLQVNNKTLKKLHLHAR
jgi:hypothetical protein